MLLVKSIVILSLVIVGAVIPTFYLQNYIKNVEEEILINITSLSYFCGVITGVISSILWSFM